MAISISCENAACRRRLQIADDLAGRWIKCPTCGQRMIATAQDDLSWVAEISSISSSPISSARPFDRRVPARARPPLWPWFAGAGLILLLVVGLTVIFNMAGKRSAPAAAPDSKVAVVPQSPEKPAPTPATKPSLGESQLRAKSLAAEKERQIDRVVDYIVAYEAISVLTRDDSNSDLLPVHRIAAYDESLELRVARCLVHVYEVDDPAILERLIGPLLEEEADLISNAEYTNALFKNRLAALKYRAKLEADDKTSFVKLRKVDDYTEQLLNDGITPAVAADIVRVAEVVRSATTNELSEARTKMREQLRQAVIENPDILKYFALAQETSDDIKASRQRVSELLNQAQKK